jgi:hypothetical protein
MFVLVVSLTVKPGKDRQFLAAIEANAAAVCVDEQVNTATSLVFSGDPDHR